MDEERFDEITRSLGDGADRRGFLRRLAALTFGGLTAVVSTRAEASKKPKPKPKPKPWLPGRSGRSRQKDSRTDSPRTGWCRNCRLPQRCRSPL